MSSSSSGSSSPARLGPYRVVGQLGVGAVGQVFHVEDDVGRQLALKLFTGAAQPERLERFAREAEVAAGLRHSGIVSVHGTGVHQESPFIVYELVEGEDLEHAWRRLTREQLLQAILEIADALGHAHAQGVIHRDLKPANVLLDGTGRARVTDFGMAQAVGMERLTRSGAMVGTPSYMAPEQVTGARERYAPHTDVWALGVLLYRALCGRLPFDGGSLVELVVQITSGRLEAPRRVDPSVHPALEAVCLRALERDPEQRIPDASGFASELRGALLGEAPASPRGRATTPRVLLGGVALALVGGWLATRLAATPPPEPERQPPASTPVDPFVQTWAEVSEALAAGDVDAARVELLRALSRAPQLGLRLRTELVRAATEELGAGSAPGPAFELLTRVTDALPPGPPDDERPLANAAFGVAVAPFLAAAREPNAENTDLERLARDCLERLKEIAAAGLRPRHARPPVAPELCEALSSLVRFHMLEHSTYWSLLRVLVELDLPVHPDLYRVSLEELQGAGTRPWGASPGNPWERFVEDRIALRITRDSGAAERRLRELVEGEDLLGPVQRAQLALAFVGKDSPDLQLLNLALRLAPELPEVHAELAEIAEGEGTFPQALEHAERALRCFQEGGYSDLLHAIPIANDINGVRVTALGELGRRDEAREVFHVLILRATTGRADHLRRRFPWLDGEEDE